MRIVGGRLRGRRLESPRDQSIRPTTDRNRESLFNVLSHRWPEHLSGRVLDVFAGTGALGLEALSRGAQCAVFIERSAQGQAIIRRQIEMFDLGEVARVLRSDATRAHRVDPFGPFDLIFADPPYGKGLGERAVDALRGEGWLAKNSLLVVEENREHLPQSLDGFELLDTRRMGETSIGIYQYVTP